MREKVAIIKTVLKKEMVLTENARNVFQHAFNILTNISEEWDEDFPEFKKAYEALEDILTTESFEKILTEEE